MIQRDQKIMTSLQAILFYTYKLTSLLGATYLSIRGLAASSPALSSYITPYFLPLQKVNPGDFMEFDFSETHSH